MAAPLFRGKPQHAPTRGQGMIVTRTESK